MKPPQTPKSERYETPSSARADGPDEAQRRDEEEGRGLDHVGVVVRVVVAVCGRGSCVGFYGCGAGRGARAGSRGGRRAQWPGERTDRGRPRGAAASESRALAARRSAARRSRSPTASRGATASERAAAGARPRGPSAAPRRRGAPPRRPRAPHLVVREKAFRRGGGAAVSTHRPRAASGPRRGAPTSWRPRSPASSAAGQRRDSASRR